MTTEIQSPSSGCFLFVEILCSALNWVTAAAVRAKFSLANTVLITSPTQTFLLRHSQLTPRQQGEQEVHRSMCNTTKLLRATGCCLLLLLLLLLVLVVLHRPLFLPRKERKRKFIYSSKLPECQCSYSALQITCCASFVVSGSDLFSLSLASLRCSSEKQPVLGALSASEPSMDGTAPGSPGAFSVLVRPRRPVLISAEGATGPRSLIPPLTACLLWPFPSQRARGLPKGVESASWRSALPEFIPLFFVLVPPCFFSRAPERLLALLSSTSTVVLYCSVHCAEKKICWVIYFF